MGPRAEKNKTYINLLTQYGVLATEMETSALFIQSQLYNYQLMLEGPGSQHRVLGGAILGIISITPNLFSSEDEDNATINNLIKLAFGTIKTLAAMESNL